MAKIYAKNTWVDEVLADDERYDILEDDGTPISEDVQIALATAVTTAGSPVNADRMNNIEEGIDDLDDLVVGVLETLDVPNLTEKTTPVDADMFLMFDSEASNAPKMIQGVNMPGSGGGGASTDGWNADTNTWTYSSVDDPTGVFTIAADATSYLSVGMRIKMTNGGNTIYGIITKAPSYSSPNTTVTFLHEIDPTDSQALYLMANSAITSPCYSTNKVPFGFPIEPTKWTVKATDSTGRSQATPASETWYNLGSLSLSVPIGMWKLGYSVMLSAYELNTRISFKTTLSTANNSQSDADFTNFYQMYCSTALGVMSIKDKDLSIASKTSYYLNSSIVGDGIDGLYNNNADSTAVIKAVCAYL